MGHGTDVTEVDVMLEGCASNDLKFYEEFFAAALEANTLLHDEFNNDPSLRDSIANLETCEDIDFEVSARKVCDLLEVGNGAAFLNLRDSELFIMITIMAHLGFFTLTGARYQLTVPKKLTVAKIKNALFKLLDTEDSEYFLHPEKIMKCMPYESARFWQLSLSTMDERQRIADRNILLED